MPPKTPSIQPKGLLNLRQLSAEIGIPARALQRLYLKRAIPVYKLGHRSVFFDPVAVLAALERYKIREVC
jgi:hypothetical protein